MTFHIPREFSLEDLPVPDDSLVELVVESEKTMAVLKYKGNWSASRYRHYESKLQVLLAHSHKWVGQGVPYWARYNSPFMPGFMRTNEVAIEVTAPGKLSL